MSNKYDEAMAKAFSKKGNHTRYLDHESSMEIFKAVDPGAAAQLEKDLELQKAQSKVHGGESNEELKKSLSDLKRQNDLMRRLLNIKRQK